MLTLGEDIPPGGAFPGEPKLPAIPPPLAPVAPPDAPAAEPELLPGEPPLLAVLVPALPGREVVPVSDVPPGAPPATEPAPGEPAFCPV